MLLGILSCSDTSDPPQWADQASYERWIHEGSQAINRNTHPLNQFTKARQIRVSTINAFPGDYTTLALTYVTADHNESTLGSPWHFFYHWLIQTTMGLACGTTKCAACWLDNNSNGVDIKMTCNGECPKCPSGYSRQHCAEERRCR